MADEFVKEGVQCLIRDDVNKDWVNSIHENICSGLPLRRLTSGRSYCVFHLPIKEKKDEFKSAFEQKLESFETTLKTAHIKIEAMPLSTDEKRERKEEVFYDFRYVYFPSAVELNDYIFHASAHFTQAIFTEPVDFTQATFTEPARFDDVVFDEAYFRGATFFRDSDFRRATFNRFINFTQATFTHDVTFLDATFAGLCDFSGAIFAQQAVFKSAKFLDNSEVFFQSDSTTSRASIPIRFCSVVDFQYASLAGFIDFRGARDHDVFLDREAVSQVKDELSAKFVDIEKELSKRGFSVKVANLPLTEAVLNLQNVQVNSPGRLSFHRVRLRPGWFINIDSRKLIFTSVSWENLTRAFVRSCISDEIASLESRGITEEAISLLEVSCRQLGANAEENSRYAEASDFRRIAMALEWRTKKEAVVLLKKRLRYSEKRADTGLRILRSCGELAMHGVYRVTSCYGESWTQAAGFLLILVLAIFPFAYSRTSFLICPINKANPSQTCEDRRLSFSEGIRYSLVTATLQNTESRRPNSAASETLTIIERILGPIQAALLALAIRRRFIR